MRQPEYSRETNSSTTSFLRLFAISPNRWKKEDQEKSLSLPLKNEIPCSRASKMKTFNRSINDRDTTPCGSVSKTDSTSPLESFTLPSSEFEPRGKHFSSQHQWLRDTFLFLLLPFLLLLLMLPTSASFFLQPRQRLSNSSPGYLTTTVLACSYASPHTGGRIN